MKRYVALLLAVTALAVAIAAGATTGRVPVANRVAGTPITAISGLPGLRFWVQPSGINATSGNVDSWTDSSSSGYTVSETLTNRPTVATSVLNGFNGVTFTKASSQRLSRTNAQIVTGNGTGITIGMIVREDTLDAAVQVWFSNANGGFSTGIEVGASTGSKYDFLYPSLGGTLSTNSITAGGFHVLIYRQDGFMNGEMLLDGTAQVLTNVLVPGTANELTASSTGNLRLGGRTNGTTHANVTLVEVFACEGVLSQMHAATARSLWKAKYPSLPFWSAIGDTLPANDNDAGEGRETADEDRGGWAHNERRVAGWR